MSTRAPIPSTLDLQTETDEATPLWVKDATGKLVVRQTPPTKTFANSEQVSYHPEDTKFIGVPVPSRYTPPVAAHETTHAFQDTRNRYFRSALDAASTNPVTASERYGGVAGLKANGKKGIGEYNAEEQANMVRDLTAMNEQAVPTSPRMTPTQLQQYDDDKAVLENKVNQLKNIPVDDKPTWKQRVDDWMSNRRLGTPTSSATKFIQSRPLESMFPDKMPIPAPLPPPVSSVGMGSPVPSKLAASPENLASARERFIQATKARTPQPKSPAPNGIRHYIEFQ